MRTYVFASATVRRWRSAATSRWRERALAMRGTSPCADRAPPTLPPPLVQLARRPPHAAGPDLARRPWAPFCSWGRGRRSHGLRLSPDWSRYRPQWTRPCTTAARLTRSVMISRNRSAPTSAAMSIECTTSANSTVTCLYSAASADAMSGDPHASQNRAPSCGTAPHDWHAAGAAVTASSADPAAPTDWLIRSGYGFLGLIRGGFCMRSRGEVSAVPDRTSPNMGSRCPIADAGPSGSSTP